MCERKFTLSETLNQIDKLTENVAVLLAVAAEDMEDVYEDDGIPESLFNKNAGGGTGAIELTKSCKRFARLFVERLISDEDFEITFKSENVMK